MRQVKFLEAVLMPLLILLSVVQLDPLMDRAAYAETGVQSAKGLRNLLREAISQQVVRGFSGAVLVAQHDRIILNDGFGFEKGVKIDANTKFWIASAGKQFVSAGMLLCEERGWLTLDDAISKFFPSTPADKRSITIRQLLTHTSGFVQSYVSEGAKDRDDAVRKILGEPLTERPGLKFIYSNSNYQLAAAIIEVASGKSYADFVRNELWQAANLHGTGFSGDAGSKAVVAAKLATPPRLRVSSWGQEGIYSTTGDLYHWYTALKSGRILSHEEVNKLFAASVPIVEGLAALGWFVGQAPSGKKFFFTRGNEDFGPNSLLYAYPDNETVIVVLTHAGYANQDQSWSRFILAKLERLLALNAAETKAADQQAPLSDKFSTGAAA